MQRLAWMGLALAAILMNGPSRADAPAPDHPNFVVLLIDDGGFSDFGAYGGEARTPNIDALAARGAIFSSYHSSPLCSPSRAMLLTGMDNHRVGFGTIPETLPAGQVGKPGYDMRIDPGVQTVAARLKAEGYRTYATGKWHLGHGPGDLPDGHGFDHSLVLDASGADNWEQKPYMPYYTSADWFEDGQQTTLPKDFYSSDLIVGRMIDFLERDKARTEPFFAYVAFQAVHIPVQAPKELTDHYAGVYDAGWEAARRKHWEEAKARGLIPQDAPLGPAHEKLRAWESLSAEDRALFAKSMAVHAGMLEAVDQQVGRLIEYLKQRGQFENTIFFVTSDNGPDPSDPVAQAGFKTWMSTHGYTRRLENLGEKGSMVYIGAEWANAASSPGRLFKFHSAEGGLRVPLIVAGPGVGSGERIASTSFVTDITPTVLDYAGATVETKDEAPMLDGRSLRPVLTGQAASTYPPDAAVGIEVGFNAALFKGDYKITRISRPWSDARWRLYHLSDDPGETADLAAQEPERFAELQRDYASFEKRVGVLPLPEDFDPHKQVAINALQVQLHLYRWVLAGAGLLLLAGAIALVRRFARRRPA